MFKQIFFLSLLFLLLVACTPGGTEIAAEIVTLTPTAPTAALVVNPTRTTPVPPPIGDEEPIPATAISANPNAPTAVPVSDVTLSWQPNPNAADLAFYQALNQELSGPQANLTLLYDEETDPAIHAIKLKTELAAGVGPDVFWLPADELAEFVSGGMLLDLRPYAAGYNTEQFYPGPVRHLTFDPATGEQGNRLWGLPSEVSTLGLYLNLDLLAAAPDPRQLAAAGNWNWDAFLATAQAVNDPGAGVYGYEQPWFWWSYGVWANAAGGSLLQADGSCGLTTAESLTGFTFAHQLFQKAQVAAPYGNSDSLFLQGKVGMALFPYGFMPHLQSAPFNWDVVELPAGPAGSGNWLFWGAYVVNAYTSHPQEAWQLLQALTSAETQARLIAAGNVMPSRLDAVETFLASSDTANRAFVNGLHGATAVAPNWNENLTYDDFSCSAVTHLLNGTITLDDFSTNACNQFTQASITICP